LGAVFEPAAFLEGAAFFAAALTRRDRERCIVAFFWFLFDEKRKERLERKLVIISPSSSSGNFFLLFFFPLFSSNPDLSLSLAFFVDASPRGRERKRESLAFISSRSIGFTVILAISFHLKFFKKKILNNNNKMSQTATAAGAAAPFPFPPTSAPSTPSSNAIARGSTSTSP